jgi:hypothetical protein
MTCFDGFFLSFGGLFVFFNHQIIARLFLDFHYGVYFALICFHLPPYLLPKGEVENLLSGFFM